MKYKIWINCFSWKIITSLPERHRKPLEPSPALYFRARIGVSSLYLFPKRPSLKRQDPMKTCELCNRDASFLSNWSRHRRFIVHCLASKASILCLSHLTISADLKLLFSSPTFAIHPLCYKPCYNIKRLMVPVATTAQCLMPVRKWKGKVIRWHWGTLIILKLCPD